MSSKGCVSLPQPSARAVLQVLFLLFSHSGKPILSCIDGKSRCGFDVTRCPNDISRIPGRFRTSAPRPLHHVSVSSLCLLAPEAWAFSTC